VTGVLGLGETNPRLVLGGSVMGEPIGAPIILGTGESFEGSGTGAVGKEPSVMPTIPTQAGRSGGLGDQGCWGLLWSLLRRGCLGFQRGL